MVGIVVVAGVATLFLFQCKNNQCLAFRNSIQNLIRFHSLHAPCERPITYALGSFNDKFGLSKQSFLGAIKEAEAIWEKPIGKELFAYKESGNLKINLIYDYRQEATSILKSLGIVVREDKASYNELKVKYDALNVEYLGVKADYDKRVASFKEREDSYNAQVDYWNKRGGAPKKEHDLLEEQRVALEAELTEIQKIETSLGEYIDKINSLAIALNSLVATLNLNVGKYNEIGASRGEEFTEGDYQTIGTEQKINIYEFSNHDKLVRVLAHELGHALGLPHVEDPKAIMYKLNTSTNENLTNDDFKELKTHCAIK